jgi:hypothetical protein
MFAHLLWCLYQAFDRSYAKRGLIAAALLFLGLHAATLQADVPTAPLFTTPTAYDVEGKPFAITTADFNLDGQVDFAVAQQGSAAGSVYLGSVGGGFTAAADFVLPSIFNAGITSGDFNGDARPDLALTDYAPGTIRVLLGRGDGTFGAVRNFSPGLSKPWAITTGDFNGDGRLDLVSANQGTNRLCLLLGNGDGSFQAAQVYSRGVNSAGDQGDAHALRVADFNGDGRADVAATDQVANKISILLGNGDGTLQPATMLGLSAATGLDCGDLNGDGRVDLVVSQWGLSRCAVYLGNGNGTFVGPGIVPSSQYAEWVVLADFNQDGRLDLSATDYFGNRTAVHLGNGDGTFGAATFFASGGSLAWSLATAEFNNDGLPDLAVGNQSGGGTGAGSVGVLLSIPTDTQPPTTTAVLSESPNANGWHRRTVRVELDAADDFGGTGVQQITYRATGAQTIPSTTFPTDTVAFDISAEGVTTVYFFAKDRSNHTEAEKAITLKIDKTAPSISGAPDRAANLHAWYRDAVTVHFTTSDALSGIDQTTLTADVVLAAEGRDQRADGSVADQAGNVASASVTGINIDRTAPGLTVTPDRAPDSNGWYNANVTVHFEASDALSGVDASTAPGDVVLSEEGRDLVAQATVSDLAGNTTTEAATGINIDKTAPVLTATPDRAPNSHGWYNADVTVRFEASDALSGLDGGPAPAEVVFSEEGRGQSAEATAADLAGNAAMVSATGINIDRTPPVISAATSRPPDSHGWYNHDVVVAFTTSDELSGIDPATDPQDVTVSREEADQWVDGTVLDLAGNSASAAVEGISLDKTAPVLNPTITPGGTLILHAAATADPGASDALSGVDPATVGCDQPDTSSVGAKSLAVRASDIAGNSASATLSYVVAYGDRLLFDNMRPVKSGATLPLKLQLTDAAGVNVSSASIVVTSVSIVRILPVVSGDPAEPSSASPDTNFRYDAALQGYIYNLKTSGYSTGTYLLTFRAGADPTDHHLEFRVK